MTVTHEPRATDQRGAVEVEKSGPPQRVALANEPYVGRPIFRVEDLRLLTGRGRYGADFDRPSQLHARIVRSQIAHGRIRSVDVDAAARLAGVVRVITAADISDVRIPIR